MPQLGETVTEGTVAQWLKKVGDSVEKYEAFVEVSTDKVNAEVPSPVTGIIREMLVKEGETVPTGAAIAVIDEVGAAGGTNDAGTEPTQQVANAASAPPAAASAAPSNGAPTNGHTRSENVIPSSYGAPGGLAPEAGSEDALRKASPAVRKLAREHHIDIRALRGSGANGRVTAEDVLTAASMGPAAAVGQAIATGTNFGATPPPSFAVPNAPAGAKTSTYGEPIPGTVIPFNQARRIIASAWWNRSRRRRMPGRWSDRRHQRLEVARARERPVRARDRI